MRPLAQNGLPLYAQHVDPIDTGTLVDMFRAERDAYRDAGVSYVVAAPWRTDLDAWLRSMELLAELVL